MVPSETIDLLFSVRVRIAFTLREHILVISEISIQQRQDLMSKESDLALEEMEGDQLEWTRVTFFKGLGSGYSKELLNDVRACIIYGGEYAAELTKDKTRRELCGERQACLLFKRGSVFKTTRQSCEGLGLKL